MSLDRSDGDAGVASGVIAFLIAGVLFMSSIVAVLVVTRDQATGAGVEDAPDAAAFTIQADTLADLVFRSTGFLPDSTDDWAATVPEGSRTGKSGSADGLARLGLLDADEPDMLDYKKFQNLRNAPFEQELPDTPVDCDGNGATNPTGDCFVNYVEAREALGLDDAGLDFHLRAYPSLQSVAGILNCPTVSCKDPNLQVTYIGNIVPSSVPPPPPAPDLADDLGTPVVTCTAGPLPKTYRLATTIVNGGEPASPAVLMRASFTADFAAGPAMIQNSNGAPVAQGTSATFFVDAPAYDGRTCADGTEVQVDIHDVNGILYSFTTTLTSTTAGVTTANKDLWVEANDYFLPTSTVGVSYYGNNIKNLPAVVEIRDGDLDTYQELVTDRTTYTLRYSTAIAKMKNGGDSVSFGTLPAGCGGTCPAVYTAIMYDGSDAASATALRVTERIVVLPNMGPYIPLDPFDMVDVDPGTPTGYGPSGDASDEVAMLEILLAKFCPTYWDEKDSSAITNYVGADSISNAWTAADWTSRCEPFKSAASWQGLSSVGDEQMGDVFPANDKVLRDGLICRLTTNCEKSGTPRYDFVDVLVVGSGVEHNEMASNNIKGPIETWVEGGGTLIVLGSEVGKNNNWLNPFLNSGTRSSGGGVSVPDPAHPVLHVPDELDYPNYENDGEVWEFRGSSDANDRFTQVVSQGEDGEFEPILAISKPGALRDDATGTSGTVILTTWVAYDLYLGANDAAAFGEGLKFLNNLLMMGYGDLYLDYGPDIPDETNVVPAVRVGQIRHPDFSDPIEVTLITFVFGG